MNIALAGNPNSGKTSMFNVLTGLNQKVGNFPGVTVDKKIGYTQLPDGNKAKVIDLPGTYSLYPKSADEYVAYETLINPSGEDVPDVIVVVADATNLKRNLLFCSQIMDLKKPVILVLTMMDIAGKKGLSVDENILSRMLGIPVLNVNPREGKGVRPLKEAIVHAKSGVGVLKQPFVAFPSLQPGFLERICQITQIDNDYAALHIACASERLSFLTAAQVNNIEQAKKEYQFSKAKVQAAEVLDRYATIDQVLQSATRTDGPENKTSVTARLDKILLHKVWGNLILMLVLILLFQSIFWLASYPMDWIDSGFGMLTGWLSSVLPEAWWSDLIINGLIAGIGGVVVFVPQIAILFGLITILEDSGYMARISFLTDRLMRSVGMNGRAAMPLISGLACAIPAVMATRIIENKKERLIAILITPLMSCSARLPVYTILISLVIPKTNILGFLSLQGLVMMGLYLLGFVMALVVSKVLSILLKTSNGSMFLMELPLYRAPRWRNALQTMAEKAMIFVKDAGKVIMVISVVLWALASYGPSKRMAPVDARYEAFRTAQGGELTEAQKIEEAHEKLEHSYAGIMGKAIEPAIEPLGYDWKIGIALITSFAAREAYVGTIATLYSVGDADGAAATLKQKMAQARHRDGSPVYTLAAGSSLLVFYVFAMQCMSTLAIVKRETKSWKWPLIQFAYMSGLAYICALIVYQVLK
jgi:ferrous iron transport protein B